MFSLRMTSSSRTGAARSGVARTVTTASVFGGATRIARFAKSEANRAGRVLGNAERALGRFRLRATSKVDQ